MKRIKMTKVVTTKIAKLIKTMQGGKNLSEAQLSSRTGLVNPRADICRLRAEGYKIYTNVRNNRTVYRMA